MGTKAIRFTGSELATLEQLITAASEAGQDTEALNTLWLKVTGRKPAPKAKARKASAPREGVDVQAIADQLAVVPTREAAFDLLWPLRVAELAAVAGSYGQHGGIKLTGKMRRDEQVEQLIHFTVGMRLAHQGVRGF